MSVTKKIKNRYLFIRVQNNPSGYSWCNHKDLVFVVDHFNLLWNLVFLI